MKFNPGEEMVKQLNKIAPKGKVVNGLLAAYMIAKGNDFKAKK